MSAEEEKEEEEDKETIKNYSLAKYDNWIRQRSLDQKRLLILIIWTLTKRLIDQ